MHDKISPIEGTFARSDVNPNLNLLDLSKAFKHRFQEAQNSKESRDSFDAPSKEEYDRYPDEVKQMAKRATEIISKVGHFGHYGKREEMKDMFADAADKGSHAVEQLKNAIKFELKKSGAPYQIEGGYKQQTVTVDETNYPKYPYIRPYIEPVIVVYNYTGANIKLIKTGSNQTEDTLTVRGKELSRDYSSSRFFVFPNLENHLRCGSPQSCD